MPERYTPIDILNFKFRRQVRGYATDEVDAFTRRAASDLEAALTDSALQREKSAGYERELSHYRTLEATMHNALVMAQKAADESRTAAHAQAELQILEAQARIREMEAGTQVRLDVMTTRIEELRRERLRLARDLKSKLSAQLAWVTSELESDTVNEQATNLDRALRTQAPARFVNEEASGPGEVQQDEGG